MEVYYNKAMLYKSVRILKNYYGYPDVKYGIDILEICTRGGILVERVNFKTKGLRGIAALGDSNMNDVILLNQNRSKREQNFDCGHEVMHLALHRKIGLQSFNCFDKVKETQNPFWEWQANEGAAEFFVPYKAFLPLVKGTLYGHERWFKIDEFKLMAASLFNVPEAVIKFRLDNLKYEIYQYFHGIELDNIEILSRYQQSKMGLQIESFNDIRDRDAGNQPASYFRKKPDDSDIDIIFG